MKPTSVQYLFAQDWPLKVWRTVIPLLCVAAVVTACEPTPTLFTEWESALWFGCALLLALPLGWFAAILVGWFVLGPLYYGRGLDNGAPFQPGDRVRILVGPHRDRIACVYARWQGDSVRVGLGEKEKEDWRDVFCSTQLLREESVEPVAAVDRPLA